MEPQTTSKPEDIMDLEKFLETVAPGKSYEIPMLIDHLKVNGSLYFTIQRPQITLHCKKCNGERIYRCDPFKPFSISDVTSTFFFLTYRCSNCALKTKTFALAAKADKDFCAGEIFKVGETPQFGSPTPSRLLTLIGPDSETFLKGRRCENQGLGVGAFAYYRRVVENQKNRMLEEIKRVSEKLGTSKDIISVFDKAIKETQFSKAMDIAKDVMPEILRINGHSPMALLYSALSEGVHNFDDQECLGLATSVRVVLTELSDRLSQAIKDEAELTKAMDRLLKKKSKTSNPPPG